MSTYDSWKTHDPDEDYYEMIDTIEQSKDYEERLFNDEGFREAIMCDLYDLAKKRADELVIEMYEEWLNGERNNA